MKAHADEGRCVAVKKNSKRCRTTIGLKWNKDPRNGEEYMLCYVHRRKLPFCYQYLLDSDRG